MENIIRAMAFATEAHKGQTRKSTEKPFVTHPLSVGLLLAAQGCREEVIIAGLLHDVVEDTEIELVEIESKFGVDVAKLVWCASEPDKTLSWEERKNHTLETIKTYGLEEKMVICADKVHNVASLIEDRAIMGEEIWDGFKRGKNQQEWYYKGIYASLCEGISPNEYPKLFHEYKGLLDELF